jgi:apolipoprotein N-acyltransferase
LKPRFGISLVLAGVSALLLILTFPKFDVAWLAPFALAPLLVAVAKEGPRPRNFLLGWIAGLIYWAGTCYWIHFVLAVHGGMAGWAAWLGFALFCGIKALHFAFFALLAGLLMPRRWAVVAVPALWVAIESTHGLFGFAWLDLGNAGVNMAVLARLAPFTGVYGLSFAFAMMGTAVALLALRRPRLDLVPLLAIPLVAFLPSLPAAERGAQTAVLVQPNISEEADWTPQWIAAMQSRLLALTLKQAFADPAERPALIVWPEMPMPLYYYQDPAFRQEVNALARQAHAWLILNATPHNPAGAPLNSALLVSPQGEPAARYDKVNLVPFGEFVPRPFKSLVEKVSTESSDFAPGPGPLLLPAGGHPIGAFICYESVFPDYVRRFPALGAELLVNISNDGWYGKSAARDQHLAIVRMRAAENRRWVLRATNDGLTTTIDPAGRVLRNLPPYVDGAARTRFSWSAGTTFYARHGNWFVWVCAGLTVFGYPWRITSTSPSRTV